MKALVVVAVLLLAAPAAAADVKNVGCSEGIPSGASGYSDYPTCVAECRAQPSCKFVRWISDRYKGRWKPVGWCQGLATCTPTTDSNWNRRAVNQLTIAETKGAAKGYRICRYGASACVLPPELSSLNAHAHEFPLSFDT